MNSILVIHFYKYEGHGIDDARVGRKSRSSPVQTRSSIAWSRHPERGERFHDPVPGDAIPGSQHEFVWRRESRAEIGTQPSEQGWLRPRCSGTSPPRSGSSPKFRR